MAPDKPGRWNQRRIIALIAVVVTVAVLVKSCRPHRASTPHETLRPVTATRQTLRVTKTATGEVTPQNRVEVKPPIAGRIEQVLVHEGDAVTQGQVMAFMSSTDRAALLDAARAQGPEVLARWESAYRPAPLLAPLVGMVIVRAVEAGQTVTTADPVVVIADRLIVKAQVDETDIGVIAIGQPATIGLDAFPQETIQAHVDHVAYEAKTVNNVTIYEVDVLPDTAPPFMRSGMTATVTFIVVTKSDALVLPAEAVHQEASGAYVLVQGSKSWASPSRRPVHIGQTDGKWVDILSGVAERETVLAPSPRMPHGSRDQRRNPLSPFGGGGGLSGGGSRSNQ